MTYTSNFADMVSLINIQHKPDIKFYDSGKIDISARIVHLLSLHKGDVIDIMTDGYEMYLYVRRRKESIIGNYSCVCNFTNPKGCTGSIRVQSKPLVAKIKEYVGRKDEKVLRFACGKKVIHENITYIPIITRIFL